MTVPQDLSALAYRNVLIVDDEQSIHSMYATALQPTLRGDDADARDGATLVDGPPPDFDFRLHHAYSGEEALRLCKSLSARRQPIQMAFVDMKMTPWDGIETIQQLRNFDPRLSFIIVTGFPDHTLEEVGQRLGASPVQVLAKPADLKQLYLSALALVSRWNRLHGDC